MSEAKRTVPNASPTLRGAKLPQPATSGAICKGCGAALKPDSRFCVACGLAVGGLPDPDEPEPTGLQ